jgi:hypothetical protein
MVLTGAHVPSASEHVQSAGTKRTVHKECTGGVGRIVNREVVELGCVKFESAGEG